jgi:hypothetical protein
MPRFWLEIDSIGSIDATDREAGGAAQRRNRLVDLAEITVLATALD